MNIDEDQKITRKLRVAVYVRVSSEEQAEMYGQDMQLTSITNYIKAREETLELAGPLFIYKDDVSGTKKIEERVGLARLFEDIERLDEKPFDLIVVYKIDRFARDLYLLLNMIKRLESYGVGFASVHENVDTSTAFGKAMLGILGVFAQFERDTIRQRTKDGRSSAAKQGVFMGPAPFGYQKDEKKRLKIFDVEAEIVRRIFNQYVIERKGKEEIARLLNEEKVPSPDISAIVYKKKDTRPSKKLPKASKWYASTLKNMLKNELYVGNYYYDTVSRAKDEKTGKMISTPVPVNDWKKSDYHHPEIVDELLFSDAQRRQLKDSEAYKKTPKNKYLLSGLIRCDSCFSGDKDTKRELWVGQPKKSKNKVYLYYKCDNRNSVKSTRICKCIPIPGDELDSFVREKVKEMLSNSEYFIEYQKRLHSNEAELRRQREKVARAKRYLIEIPQRKSNLNFMFKESKISKDEYTNEWDKLNESILEHKNTIKEGNNYITEIERLFAYADGLSKYKEKYPEALESLLADDDSAKTIINSLVDQIVIYSRPVRKSDSISGPKKKEQEIVSYIELEMKLPIEVVKELTKYGTTKEYYQSGSSSSSETIQDGLWINTNWNWKVRLGFEW